MTSLRSSLAILAAMLVAVPVLAQEGESDKGKEKEKPTFEDLKGGLQKLEKDEEKQDEAKREEMVRKNHADTLAIYDRVLRKRNGELENVSSRLKVNEGLELKYSKLLETARADLALLRSRYVNRTLSLKASLEAGKVSKETYAKLLEEDGRKFRNRESELMDDIVLYTSELETARALVRQLTLEKELLGFDPFEPEKPDEKSDGAQPPGIAERVRTKLQAIAGYRDMSIVETME